jgi:hypothetical protein
MKEKDFNHKKDCNCKEGKCVCYYIKREPRDWAYGDREWGDTKRRIDQLEEIN